MDEKQIAAMLGNVPDKSCMITILFVPENDQQAIDVKASIDAALAKIETKRYSFNLEQRTSKAKAPDIPEP